jgi:acetyl esterase/lipase
MRKQLVTHIAGFALVIFLNTFSEAQENVQVTGPVTQVFRIVDGVELKAHVFRPNLKEPLPAIVLFHGGGWTIGEPAWAFGRAQHFAKKGMVAIAAQYRLSNQNTITPLEAMSDARAVIRWMRSNAASLRINPDRIAAYGWSVGAHLAASAAIFADSTSQETVSAKPNVLILISPAVHLENDSWSQRLLGSRARLSDISPAAHVRQGLPPTIILQGSDDTVTPLAGVQLFCDRMRAAGNRCDLYVYRGVGHLFTPAGIRDDGWPQPDAKVQADAYRKADEFLISFGFIK